MDLGTRFVTAMSPAIVACALFFAQSCFAVEPAVLDLHSILGSAYPCSVPRAIQFLTEDELAVLAGPSPECFAAVDSLEIVAISLDGRVIARRPWTSTEMGLALPSGRLVLPEFGGVTIVDENLRTTRRSGSPSEEGRPRLPRRIPGFSPSHSTANPTPTSARRSRKFIRP
jgi:hypothetical protein